MNIQLYVSKKNFDVQKAERFFKERRISVQTMDLKKHRLGEREVQAMAQRLHVAKLLNDGCKYSDVAEATGASTATISRVSRCLTYGADGYKLVLGRLEK